MLCSSAPFFQHSTETWWALPGTPHPSHRQAQLFNPSHTSRIIHFSLPSLVFFSKLLVISRPVLPVSLDSPSRISPLSQAKVQDLKKKNPSNIMTHMTHWQANYMVTAAFQRLAFIQDEQIALLQLIFNIMLCPKAHHKGHFSGSKNILIGVDLAKETAPAASKCHNRHFWE